LKFFSWAGFASSLTKFWFQLGLWGFGNVLANALAL